MSAIHLAPIPAVASMPRQMRDSVFRLIREVEHYCARVRSGARISTTVRRRPVDARGRTGCCIEIRLNARPPTDGLNEICPAGPKDNFAAASKPAAPPFGAGTSLTLAIGETFSGGCRITVDARWREAGDQPAPAVLDG